MRPTALLGAMLALLALGCGRTNDTAASAFTVLAGSCPEVAVEGTACLEEPPAKESQPPEDGGCWVTGIGTFGKGPSRDSFGGNAMTMKNGSVRGQWQHVDHFDVSGRQNNGQNLFHGSVDYLRCQRYPTLNGPQVPKAEPNFANWGGTGRFNGEDGYRFDVRAFDHAEGGIFADRYAITIWDSEGTVVLEADGEGTRDIVNGPAAAMGGKRRGGAVDRGQASTAPERAQGNPRDTSCREDSSLVDNPNLAWVAELGCLSGGNFQIHPPNAGHP